MVEAPRSSAAALEWNAEERSTAEGGRVVVDAAWHGDGTAAPGGTAVPERPSCRPNVSLTPFELAGYAFRNFYVDATPPQCDSDAWGL